eukprot:gene19264-26271_t
MSMNRHYPVCIVGGGPVGMFLSKLLSSYGIKSSVIERRSTPTNHPQAHFLNARSMEILQIHNPTVYKAMLADASPADHW